MSGMTVFGIVLISSSAVGVAIVVAMFLWGAREDGRDQRRIDARLTRGGRRRHQDS
jgi:hypothetical protein